MDLVKLRSLICIAEEGSLTKAAKVLKISQPALTRHVGVLEKELGEPLFERSHGMKLTTRGRAAVHYARRIVREFEFMKRRIRLIDPL
jgi:molybdate transport repressor ModE-like protein